MVFRSIKGRLEKRAQTYRSFQAKGISLEEEVRNFFIKEFGTVGVNLLRRVVYDSQKKLVLEVKNRVFANEVQARLNALQGFLKQAGIEISHVVVRI